MKELLLFFCLLLLPFSLSFTTHASKKLVRVVRVIDGDTIEVARLLDTRTTPNKHKVRLIGMILRKQSIRKKGLNTTEKKPFNLQSIGKLCVLNTTLDNMINTKDF